MPWGLYSDSGDGPIAEGTEIQVKTRYFDAIEKGEIPEVNAFVQDEQGEQYAWNPYLMVWDVLIG